MKTIKLKENRIQLSPINTYLEDYLVSLGISRNKTESYTKWPEETDVDNPYDLEKMAEGLKLMKDAVERGDQFFLQVDSDVDGCTSAAIFYNYFTSKYPEIKIAWMMHDGKEHGVEPDKVPENCGMVIIPDAGSMQFDERRKLGEAGKFVLTLDHHTMTENPDIINNVLINNQVSPRFSNKYLSGAGIVYMFIKAYDEKYFDGSQHQYYLDLAALGIIADMMDTRPLGNNYIIRKGLSSINNKMFQQLLTKQAYSISDISNPNKIDIAFYIAPLINGLIRSGSQEEKELFFTALITPSSSDVKEREYRGEIKIENIYEQAARIAGNAKSRQDTAKKKAAEFLRKTIEEEKLDENKLIAVCISERDGYKVNPNLTGLVAMELVKDYNKPVLVLREKTENNEHLFFGSGRSKEFNGLTNLLAEIRSSGLANFAEGHGNAFGAGFTKDGLKNFVDYANKKFENVDFRSELIEVDYWFDRQVDASLLWAFAKGKHLYGAGIPQPKFAFTLDVTSDQVRSMGKDNGTMKIFQNGVDFIMFKAKEPLEQIMKSKENIITIVGRSQINEYNGNQSIQVVIDEIEITPKVEGPKITNLLDLL